MSSLLKSEGISSLFRTITAITITASCLFAGGRALIPIKILIDKSDAIVIGRIIDGTVTAPTVTITLDVQEVFKGDVRVI